MIFNIRIIRNKMKKILIINQTQYFNAIEIKVEIEFPKYYLINIPINNYDNLRSADANNKRTDRY